MQHSQNTYIRENTQTQEQSRFPRRKGVDALRFVCVSCKASPKQRLCLQSSIVFSFQHDFSSPATVSEIQHVALVLKFCLCLLIFHLCSTGSGLKKGGEERRISPTFLLSSLGEDVDETPHNEWMISVLRLGASGCLLVWWFSVSRLTLHS